jgi:hypothetical protein
VIPRKTFVYNLSPSNGNLRIDNISGEAYGVYQCVAKYSGGTIISRKAHVRMPCKYTFITVSDVLCKTRAGVRVLATVKHSALNAVFPITLRSQFPNLGQPKSSYRNSIIFFTSDNRPVPYISLKITPKMREMPFQRHKNFKNREGATACPQTHKEMPGLG